MRKLSAECQLKDFVEAENRPTLLTYLDPPKSPLLSRAVSFSNQEMRS
ncbi:hypothetical protein H1P_1580015 [Hyella patelloides LEGE 07179]|uniref:Uncharacterized protein n=1 Tax=Hyella patelloides LEGE 07179 TaxID=945734 RepID=A0A563VMG7_9CYAN|nr:hypothetical protein [Hyella patelloides]VEP12646.1 hypothetical protein H1P_1580015 [Hyella patelloides LEGE 07179]